MDKSTNHYNLAPDPQEKIILEIRYHLVRVLIPTKRYHVKMHNTEKVVDIK